MFKKTIFIFSVAILLSLPHFTNAGIVINEIMYSFDGVDSNREWIEIYNNGNSSVDLSGFSFFEAETNHRLLLMQGSEKIGAQSYALIIGDLITFKTDWPNFGGTIFDSSFSLSNSGETIALKNGDVIVDQYIYKSSSGGEGDGKSLQKINGTWVAAKPTPGMLNQISYSKVTPPVSITEERIDQIPELTIQDEEYKESEKPISIQQPSVSKSLYLFGGILVVFLGLSGGLVYWIRRRGLVTQKGDDFEILDE
jgi:hypothetical protein